MDSLSARKSLPSQNENLNQIPNTQSTGGVLVLCGDWILFKEVGWGKKCNFASLPIWKFSKRHMKLETQMQWLVSKKKNLFIHQNKSYFIEQAESHPKASVCVNTAVELQRLDSSAR